MPTRASKLIGEIAIPRYRSDTTAPEQWDASRRWPRLGFKSRGSLDRCILALCFAVALRSLSAAEPDNSVQRPVSFKPPLRDPNFVDDPVLRNLDQP